MKIDSLKDNEDVLYAASTMAIEDMPLQDDFIKELIKVSNGILRLSGCWS